MKIGQLVKELNRLNQESELSFVYLNDESTSVDEVEWLLCSGSELEKLNLDKNKTYIMTFKKEEEDD